MYCYGNQSSPGCLVLQSLHRGRMKVDVCPKSMSYSHNVPRGDNTEEDRKS